MASQDGKSGAKDDDPAEFILSNPKYHDHYLMIGHPVEDTPERIGVSSIHLKAHSLVFRDMLADSKLADPPKTITHITDVSPKTFKLMLRMIYGGRLPELKDEELINLILAGAKYKVQCIVEIAVDKFMPESRKDIFPALKLLPYIDSPKLEKRLSTLIKKETSTVVSNPSFLELDENCLIFIAKQEMLSISELQLWGYVVRWAKNQVKKHPEKTLRGCMNRVIEYIRVLTLSVEEIVSNLSGKEIFTPGELLDMTCAVTKREALKSPGLCQNVEKRRCYFSTNNYFQPDDKICLGNRVLKKQSAKLFSTLSISTYQSVLLESFTIKNEECVLNTKYDYVYWLACRIAVTKTIKGVYVWTKELNVTQKSVLHENVTLSIRINDDEPLVLEHPGTYTFSLTFNTPHSVYAIHEPVKSSASQPVEQVDSTFGEFRLPRLIVQYRDYPHVIGIGYKTKQIVEHNLSKSIF